MSNINTTLPKLPKGPIPITSITVWPPLMPGDDFVLTIHSGPYEFNAEFSPTLRSYMDACEAAMLFFGAKYGLVTLHKGGIVRATPGRKDGF